ncbi:hypothetical protein MKX01_032944 [Papaver californicum]|nr:hypothetical protein MKX01_032944 [Papaver californicum]
MDTLSFLWISENGAPWILKNDHSFFWFWEKAQVNDHGCIEFLLKVENPELVNDNKRSAMNTPKKKTISKSPQVRRIPRLTKNNKSEASSTTKKLFGHDDNLRGGSSSKPIVLDDKPVVVDEEEFDESHPVEDPEAAAAYNSDEDNEAENDGEPDTDKGKTDVEPE